MEKTNFKPIDKEKRIQVLDGLRGFAVFGILVINIGVFSGYAYMTEDAKNELLLAEWNSTFDGLHSIFFSEKFYTLFSLLFGIGFTIQLIRASKANRSFKNYFSRRLFILMLIGIVHLWGIWFSDILVIYALCGYALILFKDLSNRSLLWAAFLIMLVPGIHSWYLQTADNSYTNIFYDHLNRSWAAAGLPKTQNGSETFQMSDVKEVIQSNSWSTVLSFNLLGPLLRGYIVLLDARLFKVLAVFIWGLWAGRRLMPENLHESRSKLFSLAIVGFMIGLPLNIFFRTDNPAGLDDSRILIIKEAMLPFGNLSLATAYASSFMLLYNTRFGKGLAKIFNAVGKTALTNYILQSLICIFIFYEAGLGLGKYFGSAYLTLFVLVIFAFQIFISILWLKRYEYGPLEWLWRVLTYGRYIKNRLK